MFKQLLMMLFLCTGIVMSQSSCNSNDTGARPADSNKEVGVDTAPAGTTTAAIIHSVVGKFLDTLWVEASEIKKIHNKRLVFRFYVDESESLLMSGWKGKTADTYDTIPDLSLKKGRPSKIAFKAGNYLGNLVLSGRDTGDIAKLRTLITDHKSKYVIFAPIDPDSADFKKQVTYEILLSKDDPSSLAPHGSSSLVDTKIRTNPSPPGTANVE